MPLLVGSTGIAIFMGVLDGSVVNISLVTIARFFDVSMQEVRWISLAYLVAITAFLVFAGKLGDRYGNKLIFQSGFLIFGLGSLLCALAWTLPLLVAARIIQAVGAAATTANGIALITHFTTTENRGRAIGLNSLIVAIALSIGPFVGGFMTEYFGWQSIFLINVPLSIVGFICVQRIVPSSQQAPLIVSLDILGTLLFGSALSSFIIGLTMLRNAVTTPMAPILIFFSLVLVALFIPWEQHHQNPILDFSILTDRRILFGLVCATIAYTSLNSISFLVPFYYQDIRDLSPTETGFMILAMPICMSLIGPLAGYLSEKHNARILSSVGLIGLSLACLSLVTLSPSTSFIFLIIVAGSAGGAMALFTSPNSNSIMSATPKEKLGLVGGFIGLARNIGFTIGITLSSSMFILLIDYKNPTDIANHVYAEALGLTFFFFGCIALLGVFFSAIRGSDRIKETKTIPSSIVKGRC